MILLPEVVADGLLLQLQDELSLAESLPETLGSITPRGPFSTIPFHDLELMKTQSKDFERSFSNLCHILGLLGIIHDLYFSSNFSTSATYDIASKFWNGDKGKILPGMCLLAHNLSLEYYHIATDAQCKQILEQSIELFDSHNPNHIDALNLHMIIFLLRHLPSQIIAIWSALVKRICSPITDAEAKIDKDSHKRVCQGIVRHGVILPFDTILQLSDSPIIKQCTVMNIITVLNSILFDEISHKIQANAEIFELIIHVDNSLNSLDDAFMATCEEDTPSRIPLFEAILFLFSRIVTPTVYKSTFWSDLTNNLFRPLDRLVDRIAKWTLVIAKVIIEQKCILGPNILILFSKLISNLTLQHRSPTQGSSKEAPPGEEAFLDVMRELHLPSNSLTETFRALFHDFHDLIVPLGLKVHARNTHHARTDPKVYDSRIGKQFPLSL